MHKWSIKECQDILEIAIGDVDYYIPEDVIRQTIEYLKELKNTKKQINRAKRELDDYISKVMWEKYPDGGY